MIPGSYNGWGGKNIHKNTSVTLCVHPILFIQKYVESEDFASLFVSFTENKLSSTQGEKFLLQTWCPFQFRMCYDGGMQENTIQFVAGKYTVHVKLIYIHRILSIHFCFCYTCFYAVLTLLNYDYCTVHCDRLFSILLCVILIYHVIKMQLYDRLLNKKNGRLQIYAL